MACQLIFQDDKHHNKTLIYVESTRLNLLFNWSLFDEIVCQGCAVGGKWHLASLPLGKRSILRDYFIKHT